MAFRMIAGGIKGRSGHPKSDGWAQLLVLRLLARFFSFSLIKNLHRFLSPFEIRIYFTRVGIPVNQKLSRPVIIFRSSPNRVGDSGRFSISGYVPCRGGGNREGPRGCVPPMTRHNEGWLFHGFGSENDRVVPLGPGFRFCARGSGTGALRKPGNRSGIAAVPAVSVPSWAGRTP